MLFLHTKQMMKLDFHPIDIEPFYSMRSCFYVCLHSVCIYVRAVFPSFNILFECWFTILNSMRFYFPYIHTPWVFSKQVKDLNRIIFTAIGIIAFLQTILFSHLVCVFFLFSSSIRFLSSPGHVHNALLPMFLGALLNIFVISWHLIGR